MGARAQDKASGGFPAPGSDAMRKRIRQVWALTCRSALLANYNGKGFLRVLKICRGRFIWTADFFFHKTGRICLLPVYPAFWRPAGVQVSCGVKEYEGDTDVQ